MKIATPFLVAVCVFTSLFLESSGSGSDVLMLDERIASSNWALDECIQAIRNVLDKDTGDYIDGVTEVFEWLTEEFKPLVYKTHSKLEQAKQGTSEERKAMASELKTIIDQVLAKLFRFTNIPEIVKTVLNEKIVNVIVGNAEIVAEELPKV